MEIVNFGENNKKLILNKLQNSTNNLPKLTDEFLFEFYEALIKTRHDSLHFLILETLGFEWREEKPLKEIFDIEFPNNWGNKTPDICLKIMGVYLFCDVSISYDIKKTSDKKNSSYQEIVDWLIKKEYKIDFIHINIHNSRHNIDIELNKLNKYKVKEFDEAWFSRFVDIINSKIEFVDNNIDKEYFYNSKIKKMNINNTNDDRKYFQDEIKYANLGSYSDLDCDLDNLLQYNKNYDIEDKILDYNKNFNIDDFEKNIKKIIDNQDDPIYKKYKDNKLSVEQFLEAETNIKKLNNDYEKTIPKPTLHIMIPFLEEINTYIPKTTRDHDQIIGMIDYITKNLNEEDNDFYTNNKLNFINNLFSSFNKMMYDSKDNEYNQSTFKTSYNDDLNRQEYKKYKKNLKFYRLYSKNILNKNKKDKITNSFLRKNDIFVDKSEINELDKQYEFSKEYFRKNEFNPEDEYSYSTFLKKTNIIKGETTDDIVMSNKTIYSNVENFNVLGKLGYEKTGIKYKFGDSNIKKNEQKKTIDYDSDKLIDKFLFMMEQKTVENVKYNLDDYILKEYDEYDSRQSTILKEQLKESYGFHYEKLKNTNAFWYSRNTHNVCNELLHIVKLQSKKKTFAFINSGTKNSLIIVAKNYAPNVSDGQPFMCLLITKKPNDYTNIYGKIYKTQLKDGNWLIYTNWRRLTTIKLTFLRDSFYTTLSSTMNSVLSSPNTGDYVIDNRFQKIYSLRSLIAHTTSQKISELLMDTRYAYMSAFSIYTNINKLLIEKFGPPYYNVMELWIVKRLLERLPIINKAANTTGIYQFNIEMDTNVRDIKNIGGIIKLPSLWFDYIMGDVTELLDEIFIYVHTIKEPSNIHYENVKAISTIRKFQDLYDKLSDKQKNGLISTNEDLNAFLLSDNPIGCCSGIIIESVKLTIAKEKPFFKNIIHKINDESIGEILSTKAVIDEKERVVVQVEPTARDIKKAEKRIKNKFMKDTLTIEEKKNFRKYELHSKSTYYKKNKIRQKVMETILELAEDKKLTKTVHYAEEFLKSGKKVIADICIKSQYGSKREFYVVNIGAKTLGRVTENFFKNVCMNSPNEAISIPGDDKILEMQKMLDKIYYNYKPTEHKITYVNGDCTKWSAAETMASFISMTIAFKDKITPKMYNLLIATYNAWSNKEIQIPMDIYNKVYPDERYNTAYLSEKKVMEKATLGSTQNFLQGMFNYSSSYKAVCCTNYTINLWKKLNPTSNMHIEHMEHSDDYVLIILYKDETELEKFRVLQKICMRLHGYNDSDRKTSVQPHFMEFVSQISFNGVMLYPQIKKSKEVNLSLPCVGYKTDMEAALSRVKECSRVGCNQSFLYFFQKLHVYVVSEAYATLPGMHNSMGKDYKSLLNTPIELFGMPNPLPVFTLYCKGNINNYRLYIHGDENTKKTLIMLHNIAIEDDEKIDYLDDNIDYKYSLKTPSFIYDLKNKTVEKIRKEINIEPESIRDFWDKNVSYKFLKPKTIDNLIIWIKSMFYNKSFLEAYTKTSRADMTMRISTYVKGKVIKDIHKLSDFKETRNILERDSLTIRDYYKTILERIKNGCEDMYKLYMSNIEKQNMLMKTITKSDPTISTIYGILEKLKISGVIGNKGRTIQVALKTPRKIKTFTIENDPGDILQYIYNRDNFEKDSRTLISRQSMEKDMKTIRDRIPEKVLLSKKTMDVLSVYNDLLLNKEKKVVMFGFNRHTKNLIDHIRETFIYNFLPGSILKISIGNNIEVLDPIDGKILYLHGVGLTKDYHKQSLENICLLYTYLQTRTMMHRHEIKNILNELRFKFKEKEEYKYTCQDILTTINMDYAINFGFNQADIKIAAYFKAYFTNDYAMLDEFINSVYSFSYNYIKEGKRLHDKYGETHLEFTYLKICCEAYTEGEDYPTYLLLNRYAETYRNNLYNIALKLTNKLSNKEYESRQNRDNIRPVLYSEIKNNLKLRKLQITHCLTNKQTYNKMTKISEIKDDQYVLPIFLTKKELHKVGRQKHYSDNVQPVLEETNMSVCLGPRKLYTLPFWNCEQHDNIRTEMDIVIDGIKFSDMLKNKLIQNYLTNKLNNHNCDVNLTFDLDQKISFLKESISKRKIYDHRFGDVLGINEEYLNLTPTKEKLVQKKYDDSIILRKKPDEVIIKNEKLIGLTEFDFDLKLNDDFMFDDDDIDNESDFLIDDTKTMSLLYDDNDTLFSTINIDSNFLVEKPTIKKIDDKNFLIRNLKLKEDLQIYIMYYKYDVKLKTTNMTMPNLLRNLKYNYDEFKTSNSEYGYMCFLRIYFLLCYTFLVTKEPMCCLTYAIDNKNITLLRVMKTTKTTDSVFNNLKNNKNIYNFEIINEILNIYLIMDINEYFDVLNKEINTKKTKLHFLKMSHRFEEKINKIYLERKIIYEDDIEDIMLEINKKKNIKKIKDKY